MEYLSVLPPCSLNGGCIRQWLFNLSPEDPFLRMTSPNLGFLGTSSTFFIQEMQVSLLLPFQPAIHSLSRLLEFQRPSEARNSFIPGTFSRTSQNYRMATQCSLAKHNMEVQRQRQSFQSYPPPKKNPASFWHLESETCFRNFLFHTPFLLLST